MIEAAINCLMWSVAIHYFVVGVLYLIDRKAPFAVMFWNYGIAQLAILWAARMIKR